MYAVEILLGQLNLPLKTRQVLTNDAFFMNHIQFLYKLE